MSALIDIVAVVAVVGYVLGRQLIGEALRGRRVVILPIVLTAIGIADLGSDTQPIRPVDVVFLIVGGLVVAGVGVALGRITRLESRAGALWGQLPVEGLWLWLLLVATRVLLMVIAHGAGAHVAASTAPLLLMLGINRLAQAAVVLPRAMSAGIAFAPEKDGRQLFTGLLTGRTGDVSAPAQIDPRKPSAPVAGRTPPASVPPLDPSRPAGVDWSALGRQAATAFANHHRLHEERHDHQERRDDS